MKAYELNKKKNKKEKARSHFAETHLGERKVCLRVLASDRWWRLAYHICVSCFGGLGGSVCCFLVAV